MKLQVGQKLWWVPTARCFGVPRERAVASIGRKWATLESGERISLETLWQDPRGSNSPPARCHLSREAYEAERKIASTWHDFYRRLCHAPPKGITLDDILATAARWGIELRKEVSKP